MNAVKITPYHDFDDYECALRHHLPGKTVICADGTMSKECGVYAGQDRFVVRKKVVEELKRKGLYCLPLPDQQTHSRKRASDAYSNVFSNRRYFGTDPVESGTK